MSEARCDTQRDNNEAVQPEMETKAVGRTALPLIRAVALMLMRRIAPGTNHTRGSTCDLEGLTWSAPGWFNFAQS